MDTFPITPTIVQRLFRLARARGILQGRREAILARLEAMATDLFPSGGRFFTALFSLPETTSDNQDADSTRELGDAFGRGAFADEEKRRLAGSFYTPDAVIDRILDLVWNDLFAGRPGESRTVCDPAMGCGFFLTRLLERRRQTVGMKTLRKWAEKCLFGVDLDPGAVFMARASIWLALSDRQGEFVPDPAHFRRGEALLGRPFAHNEAEKQLGDSLDWPEAFPDAFAAGGFDVIVGNPPYEVLTNFGRRPERKELAEAIRDSGWYNDSLSGQINLYRCFIERCLDLLRPKGSLSLVVPLSLARDAAALPLRRRLIEQCDASEWLLFGERDNLFPGVTQSACIFKATVGAGAAKTVTIRGGGDAAIALTQEEIERYSGDAFALPALTAGGMELWRQIWTGKRLRLDDLCEMRVGEVDQTFFRSCMSDTDTGCILARGAHLSPFRLNVEPTPGKERFLHIDRYREMKGATAEACLERANRWRIAQLGIRNMHSRPRLVAALAPPGIHLGNSLNVYFPHDGIALEYVAGLLNATLLDWLFRLTSGNNNINLHEMRRLPVPENPPKNAMTKVIEAYRACEQAAATNTDLEKQKEILDQYVAECYGIGDEYHTLIPYINF